MRKKDIKKMKRWLRVVGNFAENEHGEVIERVDMCGGQLLAFDKYRNINGFKTFAEAVIYRKR